MKVQLLAFNGCPNVSETRMRSEKVLLELRVSATVEEVDVQSSDLTAAFRGWPSPTVLLDGQDLEGLRPAGNIECRLYAGGGAPDEEVIRRGVRLALARRPRKDLAKGAANVGAALLSVLTCPACIGPYASIVSALGVGVVYFTAAFMVVFPLALLLSLASIIYSTREHRNPWPVALTVLGGMMALAGQLVFQNETFQRAGLPLLLAGAALNFWLLRRVHTREAHL